MMTEIAASINLNLVEKLTHDPGFRQEFFWAETSASIAADLVALRKRRGLNQTQLAKKVGTKQPAISRIEQADYQNRNLNTLRVVVDALGGRLRVVIEPYEDVLQEYEDRKEEAVEAEEVEEASGTAKNQALAGANAQSQGAWAAAAVDYTTVLQSWSRLFGWFNEKQDAALPTDGSKATVKLDQASTSDMQTFSGLWSL